MQFLKCNRTTEFVFIFCLIFQLTIIFCEPDTNSDDVEEKEESEIMFNKLEDFLNPDNTAIKKLIEHHVLKKPTVLSELLSAKFSDLVTVFYSVMNSKVSTVEAAYLHLLKIIEEEGATGISERASKHRENHDELIEAVPNGDTIEYKMTEESPYAMRLKGQLNNVLSDDEIDAIIDKYLDNIDAEKSKKKSEKIHKKDEL